MTWKNFFSSLGKIALASAAGAAAQAIPAATNQETGKTNWQAVMQAAVATAILASLTHTQTSLPALTTPAPVLTAPPPPPPPGPMSN